MPHTQATELSDANPVLFTARSPVLLIFFMPSTVTSRPERASLLALANSLQAQLGGLVRVLRIDEDIHSDVVRSFAITKTPAFVLVRRGVELWRQEELSEAVTIIGLIKGMLG